ncbi:MULTISPECIES: hypothetical protein [unclassified Bradyrhizobium]|uniref:hypothetical protein n=1 Tax=unclassified Bradyrhizobium TaxID=2631580 RepID=UPI002916BDDC|nr:MULTISPECIES: hypothetical protein [unclassified Bradyrhizobium]
MGSIVVLSSAAGSAGLPAVRFFEAGAGAPFVALAALGALADGLATCLTVFFATVVFGGAFFGGAFFEAVLDAFFTPRLAAFGVEVFLEIALAFGPFGVLALDLPGLDLPTLALARDLAAAFFEPFLTVFLLAFATANSSSTSDE